MDCPMEQSLRKMEVHMYGVYITPVAFASTPDSRSVWDAALRMEHVSYCVCAHMWDHNREPTIGTLPGPASQVS